MPFARELRDLAFVPRWSIVRTIRQQNVAEHCFFVAVYAEEIARLINWKGDMATLLKTALWHDAEECVMGDIPGPSKRNLCKKADYYALKAQIMRERFDIDEQLPLPRQAHEIDSILKVANLLEETLYLAGELQMGNAAASAAYRGSYDRLKEAINLLPGPESGRIQMAMTASIVIKHELSGQSMLPHNNSDLREES